MRKLENMRAEFVVVKFIISRGCFANSLLYSRRRAIRKCSANKYNISQWSSGTWLSVSSYFQFNIKFDLWDAKCIMFMAISHGLLFDMTVVVVVCLSLGSSTYNLTTTNNGNILSPYLLVHAINGRVPYVRTTFSRLWVAKNVTERKSINEGNYVLHICLLLRDQSPYTHDTETLWVSKCFICIHWSNANYFNTEPWNKKYVSTTGSQSIISLFSITWLSTAKWRWMGENKCKFGSKWNINSDFNVGLSS